MGIKYIAVTMGYVESGSVAFLVFENQTGEEFADNRAALNSLAGALFQKYLYDYGDQIKPRKRSLLLCCEKTLQLDPVAKYCSRCARRFQDSQIAKDKYQNYINKLIGCTADEFGEELPGWWPWVSILDVMKNATVDEVLSVREMGETLFASLLTPDMVPEEYRENMQTWFSEPNDYRPALESLLKDLGLS